MRDRGTSGTGKTIGLVYGVLLFGYFEYLNHFDMSPEAYDTHLWILCTLVLVGVLAWAAVAGTRPRS